MDVSERMEPVFAAMGAIKGILDRGIRTLDEGYDYFMDVEERKRYTFGLNFVILPNTEGSNREAEELVADFDRKMRELAEKYLPLRVIPERRGDRPTGGRGR
ncbi:MAG: hypothetical protein ACLFUV_06625 [Methanomassiliicoccales archaeon]